MNSETKSLFEFIEKCPDPYHASAVICDMLRGEGYTEVKEYGGVSSGKYFVRRGNAIAAFRVPESAAKGFMISASHIDSPCFRIKSAGCKIFAEYSVMCCERYGGMLHSSWLDRPLELSGRAVIRTGSGVSMKLFRSETPAALIPSVAIHLNRKANTDFKLDPAKDLVPLFGEKDASVTDYIAELCGVTPEELVSFDGVISCADKGFAFGCDERFIASPRLDDLMCVKTMLDGFLESDDSTAVPVYCVYDGEEIGSRLRDGAGSDFLPTVLRMIAGDEDSYRWMLENTVLLSADNAHAVHPNHPELSDSNAVRLNGGVTIKRSASRSYMTEGDTDGVVCELCRRANVPVQRFFNRSDLPGGSTLGAIAVTGLPVLCADIGAPQLAMHSAVECAGEADVEHMTLFAKEFYSSSVETTSDGITIKRGI